MNYRKPHSWLAIGLLAVSSTLQAEDIDLFVGITPVDDRPNVLFIIDNAANFSADAEKCTYEDEGKTSPSLDGTAGGVEQCALFNAIEALEIEKDGSAKVNIGFMAYNANNMRDIKKTNCGGSGATGGCLLVPLMPMTADNKVTVQTWIKSWRTSGGAGSGYMKANNEATGAAMQEAWAYYAGQTGLSGRNYADVQPPRGCEKNYIVFIGNAFNTSGTPGDSDDVGTALNKAPGVTDAQKAVLGGTYKHDACGTVTFTSDPGLHENRGLYADEWARYMNQSRELITYSIGMIDKDSCKPEYPVLLGNMATVGGGKYFETDNYDDLKEIVGGIVTEIQAVNSVFASASLPVSVNTQGTYLNQVFIGMFRPDVNALPRWNGNLKQYQFVAKAIPGGGGFELNLADAYGNPAINTNTGFIAQCASSFWTPKSADTYWTFRPQKNCPSNPYGGVSDPNGVSNVPDGDVVEKGAAGYMLRAIVPENRNVYTCAAAGCGALIDFDTGVASALISEDIINWVRGMNIQKEGVIVGSPILESSMRPSALGDVVHSRPVAVDYGGSTGVVVFYGANDGMLHAIDGNQDGTGAGSELWSFVAPEHYDKFKRIYDNTVKIPFPSDNGANVKPYFFDGPVTAYQDIETSTVVVTAGPPLVTKEVKTIKAVWVYATQRRGGRMIYAFDVTTPDSPKLMWRQGCDSTSCTGGFGQIGQTWSSPKTMKAKGYFDVADVDKKPRPMIIMGGGYDTCEDNEPNTCDSPKGNRVYVLDAQSGELKKTFSTLRSVAGDVTVVSNQFTGLADYAYLADTGGNVYRITIGEKAVDDWTMVKIAALGCSTADCPAKTLNRKFLFAPEVVVTPSFNAVLIGSGDREHPLPTNKAATVNNAFFMLQDKPWDDAWLSEEVGVDADGYGGCGEATLCLGSLAYISNDGSNPSQEALDKSKGWYLDLSDTEQVVTSAVVLFGEITFSTHLPTTADPKLCTTNLGEARVYNISYLSAGALTGTSRYEKITGGGLPPSPVSGMVTVENPTDGSPMTVPFIIGASKESPVEVTLKSGAFGLAGNKERVFWYIEQ